MLATGRTELPENGLTLLEMLVVLAILGFISALAYPAIDRSLVGQRFASDAAELETRLHSARAAAIASGTPRVVDAGELDGGSRIATSGPNIVFYPDGSSRGGALLLTAGTRTRRYKVDSVNGEVAVSP